MEDNNLNDEVVNLVEYSIVSIERDRERVLPGACNRCVVYTGYMDDCSFTSWIVARYTSHHNIPPAEAKSLRVSYQVLKRWPRQSLHFQEKQLERLEGIRRAILACCDERADGAPETTLETSLSNVQPVDLTPPEPDDLTRVEGIGPKIAALLTQTGITTFVELAAAEVSRLQEILRDAGPRYRIADPTTWPRQAQLAATGDWVALAALMQELKGGRLAAAEEEAPEPEMDAADLEVLAALTTLGGEAAIGELSKETGVSRSKLRSLLGRLIESGAVQRVGKGLKTRYLRVEESK